MLRKKYKIFEKSVKFKQLSQENKFLYFKRSTTMCSNCKFNSLHSFECRLYMINGYLEIRRFCLKFNYYSNLNRSGHKYTLDKIISNE